jgi:two-component system sensor histidine kinase and response regulator WspE
MSNQEPDLSQFSMLDLFRMEVETQATLLTQTLIAIEQQEGTDDAGILEALMRAAHSIKGAARIVQNEMAVKLAHALEDCFIAAQTGKLILKNAPIDQLLQSVDLLVTISQIEPAHFEQWKTENEATLDTLIQEISNLETQTPQLPPAPMPMQPVNPATVDITQLSLHELFCMEVMAQVAVLVENLQAFKQAERSQQTLDPELRASRLKQLIHAVHGINGAARIVRVQVVVRLATLLEEYFSAVAAGNATLNSAQIDLLNSSIEFFTNLSQIPESKLQNWFSQHRSDIDVCFNAVASLLGRRKTDRRQSSSLSQPKMPTLTQPATEPIKVETQPIPTPPSDRFVRLNASTLNQLMGLAGESLVEANWIEPFAHSLLKLKHRQQELLGLLEKLNESVGNTTLDWQAQQYLEEAGLTAKDCHHLLSDRLEELESFSRRFATLSENLYRKVIASHMRPFADGVVGFPRMVRDVAKELDKQVKLEIAGHSTQVDRDILERLEAPLTQILRNAVTHGIEPPAVRLAAGKPATGIIRLEATHRAGMLFITVEDDGQGIDLEALRQTILSRQLATPEMVAQLSELELLEFLFLPGFSTASTVTELAGRGFGLDIAKSTVQEIGGNLRAISRLGQGTSFQFTLPLTLSVLRALLVEIAGEPYAFPLSRLYRVLKVHYSDIFKVENRQYLTLENQNISLISAYQILDLSPAQRNNIEELSVIVINEQSRFYGIVVDCFLAERDLVVRPLDPRLGKVPNISAAALMEDGSIVLIIDVTDLIRTIENLVSGKNLTPIQQTSLPATRQQRRILVVDDSITVREMERKLLENQGYQVDVAVDGIDAWNTIITKDYDLLISDIDMPRMNGIELITQVKTHPRLKSIPAIIVSYKEREEDRIAGLQAGADYYLTKSSFHDDSLVNAVMDLIGK